MFLFTGESYRARVQSLHSSDFNVQGSTSDSRRYSLDVRRGMGSFVTPF